jgi:glycosyltransferase involved in cell wall biosynthesis
MSSYTRLNSYDVTVIIPCYNEERFLNKTIQSVITAIEKSSLRISILISDNCSKDKSVEHAKFFLKSFQDLEIVIQKKNIGGRANILSSLSKVNSRYFMVLGAHDFIGEEYFSEIEKKLMDSNSKKQIFMPNEFMVFEESKEIPKEYKCKYKFHKNPKIRFWQLVFYLHHSTEFHSIYPSDKEIIEYFQTSRSFSIDHLIMHIYFTRYETAYMTAPFYRMYPTIVAPGQTYLNSFGESESREKRLVGDSCEEATNEYLVEEILQAGLSVIPIKYPKIAKFFLKGKYRLSKFHFWAYRIVKKILGLLFWYRASQKI